MKRKNIQAANNISEEGNSDSNEEQSEIEEDTEDENIVNGSEEVGIEEEEEYEVDDDEEEEGDDDLAASDSDEDDDEDLAASGTDSDETSEEESEEPKTRADVIKENVLQRYEERKGKQLFIRFPPKQPNSEDDLEQLAKKLSPLITNVHKPRQNHVRFCLVDFNSKEDRDATLSKIRDSIQKGELPKYGVNIPRTESETYVNDLVERKIKSVENKKAKARLKKASKKALIQKIFTPTVVVLNLPKNASLIQIREIFPNAVDIQMKTGKGKMNKDKSIASVTLPSTMDARTAVKQKISLGGNELIVKFDNHTSKKKLPKSQKGKKKSNNKGSDTGDDKCEPPQSKKSRIVSNKKGPATELTTKKRKVVTT